MSLIPDPKIWMAIKDLSLAARWSIDGFMAGINKSRVKGPGLEFSQYRSYQPGDDLRWLDWKMFARSDRYYVRESELETSVSIRFLIDASDSMNHIDNGYSKLEFAKHLAASLAYLAHKQGDSIGLNIYRGDGVYSLPSRKDPQHLHRFFYQLEQLTTQGRLMDPVHYRHIFSGTPKRELLIYIGDFHEQHAEQVRLLESIAALGHEIIAFHLIGQNELALDYPGFDQLEDLETGERMDIPNAQIKDLYVSQVQQQLAELRIRLLEKRIYYRLLSMNQYPEIALRDFLKQRQKSNQ